MVGVADADIDNTERHCPSATSNALAVAVPELLVQVARSLYANTSIRHGFSCAVTTVTSTTGNMRIVFSITTTNIRSSDNIILRCRNGGIVA